MEERSKAFREDGGEVGISRRESSVLSVVQLNENA